MNERLQGLCFAVAATFLFALQGIVAKFAYQYSVAPESIVTLRLFFILPVLFLFRKTILKKIHYSAIGAGIFGYFIAALLGLFALTLIQASLNAFFGTHLSYICNYSEYFAIALISNKATNFQFSMCPNWTLHNVKRWNVIF